MKPFLSLKNLSIAFRMFNKTHRVVDDVSFSLSPGESIAIVGESGSGKSTLVKSLIGLNPPETMVIESGEIFYKGTDLLSLDETALRGYRGKEIAMIFQDSLSSLNPTMRIGKQIVESYRKHHPKPSKETAYN